MSDETTDQVNPEPEAGRNGIDPSELPIGYRTAGRLLTHHPTWKGPTAGAVLLFLLLLFGLVFLRVSDQNTARQIDRASKRGIAAVRAIHNVEACTLRVTIAGLRDRAKANSIDKSLSPSARRRAAKSLPQLNFIINGQVTSPPNLDCKKLLRAQAAHRRD